MAYNHYSLLSVTKHVEKEIKKEKLNKALKLIHNSVMQVITEPVCTAQVFASKALDDLCQKTGKICFQNNKQTFKQKEKIETTKPVFVYLVTKLQKSGGHTRVMRDFIIARPEAYHFVFSTELDGYSDKDFLADFIPSSIHLNIKYAPKSNFEQKLIWLQNQLITHPAQNVYLFNHHQDSVIIAAVQPEIAPNLSFYHHGDHHLCLGASLSSCEHIDIHAMGFHQCQSMGIDNIYIPLTVMDKGERLQNQAFKERGSLTTCTAARSNKIEKPYFIKYTEVIPDLLVKTNGRHIHIGTLTPWTRWKIKQGLKQRGVSLEQFIYIPWVPDVWQALQSLCIDLYIASFPYGGGLTLIEAMGAGVPVAMHKHMYSRILSGIDLAYPSVFSWHFPDELINFCLTVSPDELKQHSILGREHYSTYYKNDCLKQILNSQIIVQAPKLWSKYQPQYDEFAYWLSGQFTIYHIFFRTMYRIAKKINAFLK